jgi:hypothetical protein
MISRRLRRKLWPRKAAQRARRRINMRMLRYMLMASAVGITRLRGESTGRMCRRIRRAFEAPMTYQRATIRHVAIQCGLEWNGSDETLSAVTK